MKCRRKNGKCVYELTKAEQRMFNFLRAEGWNKREIADELGLNYESLCKATKGW